MSDGSVADSSTLCSRLLLVFCQCVVGAVLRSGSSSIAIDPDKRDSAAKNCFIGAAIYAGFVALSITCIVVPGFIKGKKKGEHDPLLSDDQYTYRME